MMNTEIDRQPRYNISVVLHETGVKADRLRAWERRYQLPRPARSSGGQRLFSQYDIEVVNWLVARHEEGMSIGRAAAMWHELEAEGTDPLASGSVSPMHQFGVSSAPEQKERLAALRGEWMQACMDFNEEAAEQVLGEAFALFSLETVCLEILRAGLAEVGSRWYAGAITVQQEHFASELAMRRLHALMEAAPAPLHTKSLIVGCPPGERHTFPTLFSAMMLRYRGWKVVYLGANVPIAHLEDTIRSVRPDLTVMSASRLATAATLFDCGSLLREVGVPLAFGGRVFERIESLERRIPGVYLGGSLADSTERIEKLLRGATKPQAPSMEIPDNRMLIQALKKKRSIIEPSIQQTVVEALGAVGNDEFIQDANAFFFEDIQAALRLGDIRLAENNLEWLSGLLGNRAGDSDALNTYLNAYRTALEEHAGDEARDMIVFLEELSNTDLDRGKP